jgi:hypothetical protein
LAAAIGKVLVTKDSLEQEIQQLLPLIKERQQEIEALRRKADNLDWIAVRKSEGYYPIRFFADGLSAYIYIFDNAAVFYAWAAVEHALLIRLGAEGLRQAVIHNNNRYPSEKKLVEIARQQGVISANREKLAHRVRKLRNNYIHYINMMWDQHDRMVDLRKRTVSLWPKIVKEIQDTVPSDKQVEEFAQLISMKKEIESETMIEKRRIPYIPGDPPNSESKRFRNLRIKQFAKWIKETENIDDQQKRFDYGIERKDARDCLFWSADLLVYLDFLPK